MPAPPPTAKRVNTGPKRSALVQAIDALPIWSEENDVTHWEAIPEYSNHVPAQLRHAERRHPGREYVWEKEDIGVRIWRIK